jgi:predicted lactoylglutathione lyase
MIFLNLPVKDVEESKRFFGELGFEFNLDYADDHTACMVVDENIFVMLLEEPRFRDFINGEIADPSTTEALIALTADSREEVDRLIEKAIASGGKPWKPNQDQGPMYGGSFQDPDGHVWEVVHMDTSQG